MALFKTIEEIKRFIPVSNTKDITTILPDIEWAEKKYMIPAISQEQYDDLNYEYNQATPALTAAQERLLAAVQMPLIHFAYAKNLLVGQLHIDSSGVSIITDDRRKTAFQWQIEGLTETYCAEKAFDGMDFLLAMMEQYKADYPYWRNSSSYTITRQFFLNETADVQKIVDINNSRRTFTSLWPVIRTVEDMKLEPELGSAFFADLKAKILADTLSVNELLLVKQYIQPVLAFLSAADAVDMLPMRIRHGAFVVDYVQAGSGTIKESKLPAPVQLTNYQDKQRQKGETYLGRMKDYLQAAASSTVFPLFYSSALYRGNEPRDTTYKNSIDRSIFMM